MAWHLANKPHTLKATKQLATKHRDMDAPNVDRPLSERRLQVYRKLRAENGFRPVTWATAYCAETDQTYRINGKHTSTLFSDGEYLDNIYITTEHYHCDTLQDIANLYSTFDSQTQTRTATDINKSFAAVIPEFAKYQQSFINLAVSTLNFSPINGYRYTATTAERAEALFDNIPEIQWLYSIIGDNKNNHQHLYRVPVTAAMLTTYKKSQKDATTFWTAVRDDTGTTPQAPDRKLSKFLLTTKCDRGTRNNNIPKRFSIKPREHYVRSIIAWNAWRKNTQTELKYFPNAAIPTPV